MDFKTLLGFLKELAANNNKEWFDTHRKRYEGLRKDWIVYVDELIHSLKAIDAGIAELEAKNCIFRINKDIRFSKDKTPYKTNFGAILNRGGKKSMTSGYYLHIDPNEIFIAGGAHQPEPDLLAAIRQEIDYHPKEFKTLAEDRKAQALFGKLSGEELSRPPKGYDASNPMVDYLRKKSFVWVRNFTAKEVLDPGFTKEILHSYKQMKPLNDFLNRCMP